MDTDADLVVQLDVIPATIKDKILLFNPFESHKTVIFQMGMAFHKFLISIVAIKVLNAQLVP